MCWEEKSGYPVVTSHLLKAVVLFSPMVSGWAGRWMVGTIILSRLYLRRCRKLVLGRTLVGGVGMHHGVTLIRTVTLP